MAPCVNDDDLVLHLSKKLERHQLRPLGQEELTPELFAWFDRFQPVERCWRKIDGQWVVKDIAFTERWSDGDYRELCALLRLTLATGGAVWGAFVSGELKGFVSVEGERIGARKQYADLSSIHVSADARGLGLGRALFQKAPGGGPPAGGWNALYISAHSSVREPGLLQGHGLCGGQGVPGLSRGEGALRLPAGAAPGRSIRRKSMLHRNFLPQPLEPLEGCHHGVGVLRHLEVLRGEDFQADLRFSQLHGAAPRARPSGCTATATTRSCYIVLAGRGELEGGREGLSRPARGRVRQRALRHPRACATPAGKTWPCWCWNPPARRGRRNKGGARLGLGPGMRKNRRKSEKAVDKSRR